MFSIGFYHQSLLEWYDLYRRDLPWRALPGAFSDPYAVWVSEIMLQQTTVVTVKEYYERFLKKWPTVESLAESSLDDVLHLWQGLGYYRRAKNLHQCAKMISQYYGGIFPRDEKTLLTLPGIGSYTSAAIVAIAFNKAATVVDGNIERIMARLFRLETPLPLVKKEIHEKATELISQDRSGDYAQALMDLGSMVCTPKNPKCFLCPLKSICQSFERNPQEFPKRLPKTEKPTRYGTFFWIENSKGEVFLERRPDKGLLGNLMGFPTSEWKTVKETTLSWTGALAYPVRHTFTHFHLIGTIVRIKEENSRRKGVWVCPTELHQYALPTLMKKVSRLVLKEEQQ